MKDLQTLSNGTLFKSGLSGSAPVKDGQLESCRSQRGDPEARAQALGVPSASGAPEAFLRNTGGPSEKHEKHWGF